MESVQKHALFPVRWHNGWYNISNQQWLCRLVLLLFMVCIMCAHTLIICAISTGCSALWKEVAACRAFVHYLPHVNWISAAVAIKLLLTAAQTCNFLKTGDSHNAFLPWDTMWAMTDGRFYTLEWEWLRKLMQELSSCRALTLSLVNVSAVRYGGVYTTVYDVCNSYE